MDDKLYQDSPEPQKTGVYLIHNNTPVVIALVHVRRGKLNYWITGTEIHRTWNDIKNTYPAYSIKYVGEIDA